MTVAIVTDSTATLSPELVQQHDIHIIPLKVIFGQESYRDGIDIAPEEFYRRVEQNKELPTTSQPSVGEFVALYRRLAERYDGIVSIHISSKLSGTVGAAQSALAQFDAVPVRVVDSLSTAMGLGFVALAAARKAVAGGDLDAVAEEAEQVKKRMQVHLMPRTMDYLRWGGRIGTATAFLGTLLRIQPILYVDNGLTAALEKARGRKRALRRLVETVAERLDESTGPVHAAVQAVNNPEELAIVAALTKDILRPVEFYISDLSLVVGVHVGPGTLGVIAYREP